MSFEDLLTTPVDLQAETHSATGRGTHTVTWTTLIAGMPSRMQPINERDRVLMSQMGHNVTHKVYVSAQQSTPAGYNSSLLNQICLEGNQKRLRLLRDGVTRYLTVRGCRDFDEQGRYAVMLCEEQPYSAVSS